MNLLALKMLVGDKGKYLGIVFGLTFSALLIVQQMGIFFGFLKLTASSIHNVPAATIWVADPDIRFVDDGRPILDIALQRVRGTDGVAWAVPYYKNILRVRLPDGRGETCTLTGVDDATLIGGPTEMLEGSLADLRRSDGVIIDKRTADDLFAIHLTDDPDGPKRSLKVGEVIEINDQRATVVGICKTILQMQGEATVYTTFTRAVKIAPLERRTTTLVLAAAREGVSPDAVCKAIMRRTHLLAMTPEQFANKTYAFFIFKGGFGVFFGITVLFGFIIGVGIAGQMFYSFTSDNKRYFAILKAMGAGPLRLVKMVMLQATAAGLIGWGIGVGIAALFGFAVKDSDQLLFEIPPILLAGSLLVMLSISWLSALLSIRSVVKLDPAQVFK